MLQKVSVETLACWGQHIADATWVPVSDKVCVGSKHAIYLIMVFHVVFLHQFVL